MALDLIATKMAESGPRGAGLPTTEGKRVEPDQVPGMNAQPAFWARISA